MSQTQTADVSRYTYRVTWSVEDDEFVATCAEFPSLSWLADSQPAALQGLVDLIADTVADLVAPLAPGKEGGAALHTMINKEKFEALPEAYIVWCPNSGDHSGVPCIRAHRSSAERPATRNQSDRSWPSSSPRSTTRTDAATSCSARASFAAPVRPASSQS